MDYDTTGVHMFFPIATSMVTRAGRATHTIDQALNKM